MKVALYGEKKELLQKYKTKMEQTFKNMDEMIEIDCFSSSTNIIQLSFAYDAIILSDELMKKMIMYTKSEKEHKLILETGKHIETFNMDEIIYIEAELKNIHIRTIDKEWVIKFPISAVEKLLDEETFIKTHRSYIVNKNQIQRLLEKEAVLKNGKKIPISKYRWKEIRRKYLGEEDDSE